MSQESEPPQLYGLSFLVVQKRTPIVLPMAVFFSFLQDAPLGHQERSGAIANGRRELHAHRGDRRRGRELGEAHPKLGHGGEWEPGVLCAFGGAVLYLCRVDRFRSCLTAMVPSDLQFFEGARDTFEVVWLSRRGALACPDLSLPHRSFISSHSNVNLPFQILVKSMIRKRSFGNPFEGSRREERSLSAPGNFLT